MKRADARQQTSVIQALRRVGISWEELVRRAVEIILFGSRAADLASYTSDWDLLCVGHGNDTRTRDVELIWLEPLKRDSEEWLGSELAGHIARYGVWLLGEPTWLNDVFVSPRSIAHKERMLCRRLSVINRTWALVGDEYRREKAREIRRDLQRLSLLKCAESVPATPTLDHQWRELHMSVDLLNLAHSLPCFNEVEGTIESVLRLSP
jgi:hypothetical protein